MHFLYPKHILQCHFPSSKRKKCIAKGGGEVCGRHIERLMDQLWGRMKWGSVHWAASSRIRASGAGTDLKFLAPVCYLSWCLMNLMVLPHPEALIFVSRKYHKTVRNPTLGKEKKHFPQLVGFLIHHGKDWSIRRRLGSHLMTYREVFPATRSPTSWVLTAWGRHKARCSQPHSRVLWPPWGHTHHQRVTGKRSGLRPLTHIQERWLLPLGRRVPVFTCMWSDALSGKSVLFFSLDPLEKSPS